MLKVIPFGERFCMVQIFISQMCRVMCMTGEGTHYFLVMMTATSTASNELSWEGGRGVWRKAEGT